MSRAGITPGVWALIIASALAGGCQAKHEIYLNPDGTGKMVVERVYDQPGHETDIEELLVSTPGVAAWTDVSLKTQDKKTTFKGTALLEDLNKTGIGVLASRTTGGNLAVEVHRPGNQPIIAPNNLMDKEVQIQIAGVREEYRKDKFRDATKEAAAGSWEIRIHAPGQVTSSKHFRQAADGALEISFEGAKVQAAMDKIMADDQVVANMIWEGERPKNLGPVREGLLLKELTGSSDPVRAEIKPAAKPLFDFKAEVAAAGSDWMTKALVDAGLMPAKLPEPDPAAGKVFLDNRQPGPAMWPYDGPIPLYLDIRPADKTAHLTGVELYRVIDGNGKVVLPAPGVQRFYRRMCVPVGEDVFQTQIGVPKVATATLREISGIVRAYVVKATHEMDLGVVELKNGAKGAAMGFEIADFSRDQDHLEFTCRFDKPYPLVSLTPRDETGKSFIVYEYLPTRLWDKTHFLDTYRPAAWPNKMHFVAVVAEGAQEVDIPFRLKDITLLEKKGTGTP